MKKEKAEVTSTETKDKDAGEKTKGSGKNDILEKKWEVLVKESTKDSKQTKDAGTKGEDRKGDLKKEGQKQEKPAKRLPVKKETSPKKTKPAENDELDEDEKQDTVKKKKGEIKDHLETDVDKLYELTRDKGIIKINEAAKLLKIDIDQIEEWGRILEEHKLVRLRYPPVGEPVLILKKFMTDTEKIKEIKEKIKLKPRKRVFMINIIILACFIVAVSFYTIRFGAIRITYTQAYLAAAVIIIIAGVLIFKFKIKKRIKKDDKKNTEVSSEGEQGDRGKPARKPS
ncbi:MAG: hypothetical protein NTU57_03645 [Candidatus Aenigmarchaeota archaeon]|nr:hypothetical protein [Candidatus Aenigmarchaeota archaeon]